MGVRVLLRILFKGAQMILGITGGMGSGKTHICSILKEKYGAVIFNCDHIAKSVMLRSDVIPKIQNLIGGDAYKPNMRLNKKYIASVVFNDKEKLEQLENIVHPIVLKELEKAKARDYKFLVVEMATLFEKGWDQYVDKTLWVDAPVDVRGERVKKRDNLPFKQFAQRARFQNQGGENRKKADYVFINDGREIKKFFLELFMPM